MNKLFGTDGIRGVANVEPMTVEMALHLGKALGHRLQSGLGRRPKSPRRPPHHRPKVLIGKDTRLSGYMFETALAAGLTSVGVDVVLVGPFPTPGIAYLTGSLRADAGVVISASHNPYEHNGIKVFAPDGFKLPDHDEAAIEDLVLSGSAARLNAPPDQVGRAMRLTDASGRYIVHLKHCFPPDQTLEGTKIVLDGAHGAAYRVAPAVLEELGAEVVALGVRPNGRNINDASGAVAPEAMARAVRKEGAHLGIALDGDGDRAIFADERGEIVDGDAVLVLCALDMARRGTLKKKTVVGTVMSNAGIERTLKKGGVRLVRSPVGDRYVVDAMLREGLNLGGEQSGHIVFLDDATTGDGLLTAVRVLGILKERDRSLSELASVVERVPQVLLNVPVRKRVEFSKVAEVARAIRAAERSLDGSGRVFVRYSGTEPLARVLVEGDDDGRVRSLAEGIAEAIRRRLGA